MTAPPRGRAISAVEPSAVKRATAAANPPSGWPPADALYVHVLEGPRPSVNKVRHLLGDPLPTGVGRRPGAGWIRFRLPFERES